MSKPITLPRWLLGTRTMELNSVDVVLIMALVLRIHGTADAVRKTAMRIRDKVCMEHRPRFRLLAKTTDDSKVMQAAINIVQRATDQLGIMPGQVFPVRQIAPPAELVEPPRCHLKPMRLDGDSDNRHWRCQHCKHTKPLELAK